MVFSVVNRRGDGESMNSRLSDEREGEGNLCIAYMYFIACL
jgi:hypothetical protein